MNGTRTNHTAGPWVVDHEKNQDFTAVRGGEEMVDGVRQTIVAEVYPQGDEFVDGDRITLANACLVSAAPELVESLIQIGACWTQHNLNSTATDEERSQFISKITGAWNRYAVPALERAGCEGQPVFQPRTGKKARISRCGPEISKREREDGWNGP